MCLVFVSLLPLLLLLPDMTTAATMMIKMTVTICDYEKTNGGDYDDDSHDYNGREFNSRAVVPKPKTGSQLYFLCESLIVSPRI